MLSKLVSCQLYSLTIIVIAVNVSFLRYLSSAYISIGDTRRGGCEYILGYSSETLPGGWVGGGGPVAQHNSFPRVEYVVY